MPFNSVKTFDSFIVLVTFYFLEVSVTLNMVRLNWPLNSHLGRVQVIRNLIWLEDITVAFQCTIRPQISDIIDVDSTVLTKSGCKTKAKFFFRASWRLANPLKFCTTTESGNVTTWCFLYPNLTMPPRWSGRGTLRVAQKTCHTHVLAQHSFLRDLTRKIWMLKHPNIAHHPENLLLFRWHLT